jgi:hypothetical protein
MAISQQVESVSELLLWIPNYDREVRLKVAAALFQVEGHAAEQYFYDWCNGVSNQRAWSNMWKWACTRSNQISVATLVFIAKQHGYQPQKKAPRYAPKPKTEPPKPVVSLADFESKSRYIVQNMKPIGDGQHPYLVRKKLPSVGMFVYKGMLCIPAWKFKDVSDLVHGRAGVPYTVQLIKPEPDEEGQDKIFLSGGNGAMGVAHFISGNNRTIAICEGYATGRAHNLMTGDSVLVGFNDSNAVALAVHASNCLTSKLVFLADNDVSGAGQRAAEKVKAFGLSVIMPRKVGDDIADAYKRVLF